MILIFYYAENPGQQNLLFGEKLGGKGRSKDEPLRRYTHYIINSVEAQRCHANMRVKVECLSRARGSGTEEDKPTTCERNQESRIVCR